MASLKIGLIGTGKMGTIIELLAQQKGHSITAKFMSNYPFDEAKFAESKSRVDVWIDFSHGGLTERIMKASAANNIKLVVGTTGWYNHLENFKTMIGKSEAGVIWSSNFSVGVYAFHRVVRYASEIMAKLKEYDVAIHEIHHIEKSDAPSGTAETLAIEVLGCFQDAGLKNSIQFIGNQTGKPDKKQLLVSSTRLGKVIGQHDIYFDSSEDLITLSHQAKNRDGFALGAILAAEWIAEKKGFFGMNDLFTDLLK